MNQPLRKYRKSPRICEIDLVVSRRIKKIREIKGVSATEMASDLNISIDLLREYEAGASKIPAHLLFRMSQVTHVSLGFVFSDKPLNSFLLSGPDQH